MISYKYGLNTLVRQSLNLNRLNCSTTMENLKTLTIFLVLGVLMTLSAAWEEGGEKKFKGHRSGLYMSHSEGSRGFVHIYRRINENIGAYGLFHYYPQRNATARAAKDQVEKAINSNVVNGQVEVGWTTFLAETMETVEKAVNQGPSGDKTLIEAVVVVVDGNTATQAKLREDGTSPKLTVEVEEFKRENHRFLVMGTHFKWQMGNVQHIDGILESSSSYKQAASELSNFYCAIEGEKDKGAIIIQLFPK